MTKLNLSECCLLEASGELGESARTHLYAYIARHPEAGLELEAARRKMATLDLIPKPELSGDMQRMIPASIKNVLNRRLDRVAREEQANRRWKLIYYAITSISAAAAVVVIVAGIYSMNVSATQKREMEKVATINKAIDRLAMYEDTPNQYDRDVTDVESSITQLQTQGTAVAGVSSGEMATLIDALATVPPQPDDDVPPAESGAI